MKPEEELFIKKVKFFIIQFQVFPVSQICQIFLDRFDFFRVKHTVLIKFKKIFKNKHPIFVSIVLSIKTIDSTIVRRAVAKSDTLNVISTLF